MLLSLSWKEWRDHRWKLLGLFGMCAAMVALTGLLLRHMWVLELERCLTIMGCVLPGFVAMNTIIDERSGKTLQALRALPVSLPLVFLCKWIAGYLTLILPLFATEVFTWLLFADASFNDSNRDLPYWMFMTFLVSSGMYAWTVAAAIHMRSESTVVLVALGLLIAGMLVSINLDDRGAPAGFWWLYMAAGPMGIANLLFRDTFDRDSVAPMAALAVHALVVIGLLLWSMARYGRSIFARAGRMPLTLAKGIELGILAQDHPVLWKTWRELRVMILWYLNISVLFLLLLGLSIEFSNVGGTPLQLTGPVHIPIIAGITGVAALLMVIVIGVQIGIGDFENGVDRFWNSRAVNVSRYFWKRFLLGWLFAATAVALPAFILYSFSAWYLLTHPPELSGIYDFAMPHSPSPGREAAEMTRSTAEWVLCLGVPQISLLYGIAVCLAALLRRRLTAMVLVGAIVLLAVSRLGPLVTNEFAGTFGISKWGGFLLAGIAFMLTMGMAFIAQLGYCGAWHDQPNGTRRASAPNA